MPSESAVSVPRDVSPLNKVTVLPASTVPCINGVSLLVNAVSVVMSGWAGGVVSIAITKTEDDIEAFPILS